MKKSFFLSLLVITNLPAQSYSQRNNNVDFEIKNKTTQKLFTKVNDSTNKNFKSSDFVYPLEDNDFWEYIVTDNGEGLSSGIYFYALKTNEFYEIKKMILLR